MQTIKTDLSPWELLEYYSQRNDEYEDEYKKLQEWEKHGKKLLYNIEFPISHIPGINQLLVDLWIASYDPSICGYFVNYWNRYIKNAIKLWFLWHLKAYHKTRTKSEEILNETFTSEWIGTLDLLEIDNLRDLCEKITQRVSQICDSKK